MAAYHTGKVEGQGEQAQSAPLAVAYLMKVVMFQGARSDAELPARKRNLIFQP
jgi:hypothetical protein